MAITGKLNNRHPKLDKMGKKTTFFYHPKKVVPITLLKANE
jgi:hypothetical protein